MPTTDAIPPLSAVPGGAVAPVGPVENPGAILDRDAFLKLLVAQLKYQDPSKPADASQMVAQSAQLTMVDRLNEIADALDDAGAIDRLTLAGTMIGKDITFRSEDGVLRTERAEAVRFDAGVLTVQAGGYAVPLAAIGEVRAPAPDVPATTSAPDVPAATPTPDAAAPAT